MIDFYALTSPNVQKVYIMLEECGLPYKEIFVDVWKGDQFKDEFLKINPNNKIPAIVDHEGPGGKPYTVFESGAILLYLAEKTGKFLPKDTVKRYDVIQWLMIQLTGIGPMFGQWNHFKLFAPKTGNDYAMARYTSELKRLYHVLEERLEPSKFLGGAEYSNADIATFRGRATTMPMARSGTITRTWRAGSTRSPNARPSRRRWRRWPRSSPRARPPPTTTRIAPSAAPATPGREKF